MEQANAVEGGEAHKPRYVDYKEGLAQRRIMALRGLGRKEEALAAAQKLLASKPFIDRHHFLVALLSEDPDAVITKAATERLMYLETSGNVIFGADIMFTDEMPPEQRLTLMQEAWATVRQRYL